MIEQILLRSGSFDGVREIGGFGQPLHALYPQIRSVLASELGPDAHWLLAEPVVDRGKNRIDWYTEGDPDQRPVMLSGLSDEERRSILARLDDLLGRGRELAERYAASDDARRAQLGAILRAVLVSPAETDIYLVEGKPAITGWGFAPDRPWDALGGSVRRPTMAPAEPAGSARDVVVPEVAIPELVTVPEPSPRTQSPVEVEQPAESLPPRPEPVMEAPEPLPVPAAITPEETALPRVESPPPAESESAPVATPAESLPPVSKSSPASLLRYVVVGSRYFWSVAIIALLLVLFAAYWGLGRERSPRPIAGEAARSTEDAKLDDALAQARRQDEAELRVRLEQLLVQLAQRRGQCSSLTGSDATAVVPVPGNVDVTRSPVSTSPTGRETLPPVIPDRNNGGGQELTAPPLAADRMAIPSATPDRESRGTPIETTTTVPSIPESTPPPPATRPPTPSAANPLDVASPSRAPSGVAPSGVRPSERALEEALTGHDAEPATPSRSQPPVKAEPTPEERREFANRMTATGATSGRITVTLMWNGSSDLDLVVRCPSGRQLDFRNPAECGGTLDVDANAARGNLSDRPVENAFWPVGKAGPGVYEVAVRYVPRKDEEHPQETPFKVLLKRDGQESVYKDITIRPNAIVPVTTFTVER